VTFPFNKYVLVGYLNTGPVVTKLFRFRIKFQNEQYLHNMSHYLFIVSIDTVNVVLDLKCIRLMNMLETINTYKADPAISWAHIFITVETIICYLFFNILLDNNSQYLNNHCRF